MTLYNCKHSGDQYRITKFNSDMNVESSYLCTLQECECPRGPAPTCRHRQMLPKFLQREHVGDSWFFDFARGGWVQMGEEWAEQEPMPPLPEGVTMIVMDHPDKVVEVHNAIAEAVGEPELRLQPPTAIHIKRRL